MRSRVDVPPSHLQQFPAPLRGYEPQPEPGTHVRVLRGTRLPQATNLIVRQHAIPRRLLRGLLDSEDRIHVGQDEPLLGAEGVDPRHERAHAIRGAGRASSDLGIQHGQEIFGRDLGGGSILPLRQQIRVELSLIFRPAPLIWLRVILDVPLGERLKV